MKKSLAAFGLVAAAALAVTGCSAESSTGSSGNGSSVASAGASGGASGDIKIGVALPDGSQTYWTAWQNAVNEEAGKLGVEVTISDAKADANTMNNQISTMISSGVTGIVLAPVDVTANRVAAQSATDGGAQLITSNRFLDTTYGGPGGANPELHTGFSDVEIGQKQGELVKQACADANPCKVAIIEGTLGSSPQIDRTAGLEEAIKDTPSITIVDKQPFDYDATKAADVTESLLQKHPDLNVIAVHDDAGGVPAARVVTEQGLQDQIKVVGIGGSKDGIAAVEDGTLYGTVWVSPRNDAITAIDSIVALLKGEKVQTVDQDGRPTVSVESVSVTKENVAEYPGEW